MGHLPATVAIMSVSAASVVILVFQLGVHVLLIPFSPAATGAVLWAAAGIFVVCLILCSVFVPRRRAKLEARLAESITGLGIEGSAYKARTYLYLSLQMYSPRLLDGSLATLITESHEKDADMLVEVLKVCSTFPHRFGQMLRLSRQLATSRHVGSWGQFVLSECDQLRAIRQGSSTHASLEDLRELTRRISWTISVSRGLLRQDVITPATFRQFCNQITQERYKAQDALLRFPNSLPHKRAFASFLIDAATDFRSALLLRSQMRKLEDGRLGTVDLAFQALVTSYPGYLTRKLIAPDGQLLALLGDTSAKDSASAASSRTRTQFQDTELSQEEEEEITHTLCRDARLRLAMQMFLDGRRLNSHKWMVMSAIWTLLVTVVVSIILFVVYGGQFDSNAAMASERFLQGMAGSELESAFLALSIGQAGLAHLTGFAWGGISSCPLEPRIGIQDPLAAIPAMLTESADSLDEARAIVSEIAATGLSVTEGHEDLFEAGSRLISCGDGVPLSAQLHVTMPTAFSFMLEGTAFLRGRREGEFYGTTFWAEDPEPHIVTTAFCETINSLREMGSASDIMPKVMMETMTRDNSARVRRANLMMMILPAAYSIILFVPLIIGCVMGSKEVRRLCMMLQAVPEEAKRRAVEPLELSPHIASEPQTDVGEAGVEVLLLGLGLAAGFVCVAVGASTCGIFVGVKGTATEFQTLVSRLGNGVIVETQAVRVATEMTFALLQAHGAGVFDDGVPYASYENSAVFDSPPADVLRDVLDKLGKAHADLKTAAGDSEELIGPRECKENVNNKAIHERYRCASLSWTIDFVIDLARNAKSLNDERAANALHALDSHVLPNLKSYLETIAFEEPARLVSSYQTQLGLMLALQLIFGVVVQIILLIQRVEFQSTFNGFMTLLRRLPPAGITATPSLLAFLIGKQRTVKSRTPGEAAIRSSSDAVLLLTPALSIEFVNSGVEIVLGYTAAEDLLGQSMRCLFETEAQAVVERQAELLARGQTWTGDILCMKADGRSVPVTASLLGLDGRTALVLRDQTQAVAQQNTAAELTDGNDRLFALLVPEELREDGFAFSATATVVCIGLEKFAPHAEGLPPQAQLKLLEGLFVSYRERLATRGALVELGTVGDMFIAGSGIFTEDEAAGAEDALAFGLDCLAIIEAAQVPGEFSARCGIETGPLSVGLIDSGFCAAGAALKLGMQLQRTGTRGRALVGSAVQKLIQKVEGITIEPAPGRSPPVFLVARRVVGAGLFGSEGRLLRNDSASML